MGQLPCATSLFAICLDLNRRLFARAHVVVGSGSELLFGKKGLAAAFNPIFFWVCLSAPSFLWRCASFLFPSCQIIHFVSFVDLRSLVFRCLENLFFVSCGRKHAAFELRQLRALRRKVYAWSFRFLLRAGMLKLVRFWFVMLGRKRHPGLSPPEIFDCHSFNFALQDGSQAQHQFQCFQDCLHFHASFVQEFWVSI